MWPSLSPLTHTGSLNMSSKPITRETFITDGYERIAATKTETMVKGFDGLGEPIVVKVSKDIKNSGKIPEGYSVGELSTVSLSKNVSL